MALSIVSLIVSIKTLRARPNANVGNRFGSSRASNKVSKGLKKGNLLQWQPNGTCMDDIGPLKSVFISARISISEASSVPECKRYCAIKMFHGCVRYLFQQCRKLYCNWICKNFSTGRLGTVTIHPSARLHDERPRSSLKKSSSDVAEEEGLHPPFWVTCTLFPPLE